VVRLIRPEGEGKESFLKEKLLKDYFLFWKLSTKESTMSKLEPGGGKK
jgi:hypothetical protein